MGQGGVRSGCGHVWIRQGLCLHFLESMSRQKGNIESKAGSSGPPAPPRRAAHPKAPIACGRKLTVARTSGRVGGENWEALAAGSGVASSSPTRQLSFPGSQLQLGKDTGPDRSLLHGG